MGTFYVTIYYFLLIYINFHLQVYSILLFNIYKLSPFILSSQRWRGDK